jgi:RNAse (barnase) inhibitor barstar
MRHHLEIIDDIYKELEKANLIYELKSLKNEVSHNFTSTELIGGVCSILLKMYEKDETRTAAGHLIKEFKDYARGLGISADSSELYSLRQKEFEIDGEEFSDLKGFYQVIGQQLVDKNEWGKNWNALNDILIGGFIKTEYGEPFKLIWKNSSISRQLLEDFSDIVELIKGHRHISLELK